jgi:multidrug efflux pump
MPVRRSEPRFLSRPGNLANIYMQTSSGAQVPLSAVAHFVTKAESLTVNQQGLFLSVTLSFNLAPGAALSQAVGAIDALRIKPNIPATLHGAFEGTAQAYQQPLTTIPLQILAAIAAST